MGSVKWFALPILVAVEFTRPATAAVEPNPGGSTVFTDSSTASASYVVTPVTQRLDDHTTTISATLGGYSVYSIIFSLPFSDSTVQQAVASADAILTGDGASLGLPMLASNTTALQSSVTTTNTPSLSCAQLSSGGYVMTGTTTTTTTSVVGPTTIGVGVCLGDTCNVNAGQTDINVSFDNQYAVPETFTTTDTYLTTQSYPIAGTAGSAGPGSITHLLLI